MQPGDQVPVTNASEGNPLVEGTPWKEDSRKPLTVLRCFWRATANASLCAS